MKKRETERGTKKREHKGLIKKGERDRDRVREQTI